MTWNEGYVTQIPYTFGFYHHLSPANLKLALLLKRVRLVPLNKPFTYCELACGYGITTTILAAAYPHAQFYATDFNPTHIATARHLAESAGLTNVSFSDKSFKEYLHENLPEFDFICLHGIYSWVSEENRQAIVDFIHKKLKIGGVVYVSYNAMPGWGAIAPLQRLLLHYNFINRHIAIEQRIEGALQFLETLKTTKAAYLQNPVPAQRINNLKNHNRSYLVHEYFNEHWTALYFDQVQKDMERAKLNYLGSAHLMDHMDNLNLTNEAIQELAKIQDPVYRELVRDIYTNTFFRRDVYVRGTDVMSPMEQVEQFRNMKFVLTTSVDQIKLEHQTALGKLQLQESVYKPLGECLQQTGPISITQLEAKLSSQGLNLQRLVQALIVMTSMGYAHPVVEGLDSAPADRLNKTIMQRSLQGWDMVFLCSPVLGNGVNVSRLEQLLLYAETFPHQGLEFVWHILKENGMKFTKDGKVLETPEENWQFLQESAQSFRESRRSVLKKLGI
ncbi:MAG: class I SAM-dependent methyltransferase [Pseudanabaenaceae cyanobacterium]